MSVYSFIFWSVHFSWSMVAERWFWWIIVCWSQGLVQYSQCVDAVQGVLCHHQQLVWSQWPAFWSFTQGLWPWQCMALLRKASLIGIWGEKRVILSNSMLRFGLGLLKHWNSAGCMVFFMSILIQNACVERHLEWKTTCLQGHLSGCSSQHYKTIKVQTLEMVICRLEERMLWSVTSRIQHSSQVSTNHHVQSLMLDHQFVFISAVQSKSQN